MEQEGACLQCGSTSFYVEGGQTFCENGHDQRRGPIIGDDDLDFGVRRRITRKQEEKGKRRILKAYHGRKAFQQYIYAWQYILWKQCYALINEKGLPAELWGIVRDLWMLKLSSLEDRFDGKSSQQPENILEAESDSSKAAFTSATDTTDIDAGTDGKSTRRSNRGRKNEEVLLLVETIALNYLGILLLQYPLRLSSIHKWIKDESIPFVRAFRIVPAEIRDRLPGEYQKALESSILLTPDELQSAVFQVARRYHHSFGMSIPQLNHRVLLMQYIKKLALPIKVYPVVQKLNEMTRFKFDYPTKRKGDKQRNRYPEDQIMSLLLVATKLIFPFDGDTVKRHPRSSDELTSIQLNWKAWLEAKGEFESSLPPNKSEEMNIKDTDIMKMNEAQLDQYMYWYQKTWIDPKPRTDNPMQQILDMFPLREEVEQPDHTDNERVRQENDQVQIRIQKVQSTLEYREPISDDGNDDTNPIIRPGKRYQRFRNVIELSQNEYALALYGEAAELACLSLERLTRAVFLTEQLIIYWQRAKRRAEVFGEEIDLDAEMRRVKSGLNTLDLENEIDDDEDLQMEDH